MRPNNETVEVVANAIKNADHRDPASSYVDLAKAAIAAIPEPATVGGVTREEVLAVITGSSVWHFHPDYGNGIFTTDADELADAILALFPPAPSTVGTVEAMALDPESSWTTCTVCGSEAVVNQGLWLDLSGRAQRVAWCANDECDYDREQTYPGGGLRAERATVLTPATTREVGAEEAWDECIRAVEWAQQNGTDPLAYVYANNPYRAASTIASEAKGDGK